MTVLDTGDAGIAASDTPTGEARGGGGGGGLGRYLLIRFLLIIPTVFILVTLVFLLMRTTGDPITAAQGGRLPPEQLAERIHAAGYDRPLIVQYGDYLGRPAAGRLRHHAQRQPARSSRCSSPTARRRWSWRSTR